MKRPTSISNRMGPCLRNLMAVTILYLASQSVTAFVIGPSLSRTSLSRFSSSSSSSTDTQDSTTATSIDPKSMVKLFGRLAEKYIMLDDSGGMCCYSACSDCEFRLPGGGYRMADQSSARPKWIPSYETRKNSNNEHTSKWSTELFVNTNDSNNDDEEVLALTLDEFLVNVAQLSYAPPLGGPYVGASAATLDLDQPADSLAIKALFTILSQGKDKLTRIRMSKRLKEMANGEEGLTWSGFQAAFEAYQQQ